MYVNIWLVLLRMRNVSDMSSRENQNTHFVFSIFFESLAVYEIMCKNIVEPDRPHMTVRRLRIACWIIVLRIFRMCNSYCFATATTVTQTRFKVTLYVRGYVHCLSCVSPCQTFWRKAHRLLYTCKSTWTQRSLQLFFFAEYFINPRQWKQL